MTSKTKFRINLWSGPRNISTALMYSFAQRIDTKVYDEPLYAHYLSNSNADEYHPGAYEVLAAMENDGAKVVEMMLGDHGKAVAFFKQMTHHLVNIDQSFMKEMVNIILTRNPTQMLPSYAKEVPNPIMRDVGYRQHHELLKYLKSNGNTPIILTSENVLKDPAATLRKLCQKIGICFDEKMLRWKKGPRPEDGPWAKYWYHSVHQSTGFTRHQPKNDPFPEHLEPLLAECMPYYEELARLSI